MKTATIIGATGLIGSHIVQELLNDESFSKIKVLVRRPIEIAHAKVEVIQLDFTNKHAFKLAIAGSDVVFCAVGTTNKQMKGDKKAYRKIDYDIPLYAGAYAVATHCKHFLLVSSVGAKRNSSSFYLKMKGAAEEKISAMNIPMISIFRPSLLMGHRAEFRLGEWIAKACMPPIAFLFPSRYHPIQARDVAKAMVAASHNETTGNYIYHYKDMMQLI